MLVVPKREPVGDGPGMTSGHPQPMRNMDGPWRIAFCLPEPHPLNRVRSGEVLQQAYIQQGYIATGLAARGHVLTYVAPRSPSEIVCTADPERQDLAPLTWAGSRWFDAASKAAWRVQRWLGVPYLNVFSNLRLLNACLGCLPGHDLVHERHSLWHTGVATACRRLALPYVLFFDADDLLEHDYSGEPITGLLRRRAVQMQRHVLRAADCIICVAQGAKDQLTATWGVPAEKIVVFPNAVDVERHRPRPECRAEVRSALGVGDDPMVVFVGRFYRWHDLETLLDAFELVVRDRPQARLLLVGDGATRPAMEQRVAGVGLNANVLFAGLRPHHEVPALVSAADVAVVPYRPMGSEFWGSPMKLFESMAAGVAVAASAVGQIADVIQDGRNGLLVPPGDARALAMALSRLLGDAPLRARLGAQARRDAVERHSWDGYLSRLERLYAAVIRDQPVAEV